MATHTSSDPYNPVGYMIDGDSSTRRSTGAGQASGQSITINFGQSENFDKIEMIHDGSDYPGGYKVEISSDGINYTQVTLNNVDIGFGAKMVLIPSTPQTAQYVRISITDSSRSSYWWSITELNILWKNVNGQQKPGASVLMPPSPFFIYYFIDYQRFHVNSIRIFICLPADPTVHLYITAPFDLP